LSVIFPKWTNHLPTIVALAATFGGILVVSIVWYWFSPKNTDVGYAPDQPVLYSHKLHAGLMGMDCRYCHNAVEDGPHANVPTSEVCMNCHKGVRTDSPEIIELTAAHEAGEPIRWAKVHLLPDYAYFSHQAHVHANVGCASCHGRMDQMEVVRQAEPLSMGWCLECHRDPTPHVRPATVAPTDMAWTPDETSIAAARARVDSGEILPPQHCSACHR
jgi:hypothetical protein